MHRLAHPRNKNRVTTRRQPVSPGQRWVPLASVLAVLAFGGTAHGWGVKGGAIHQDGGLAAVWHDAGLHVRAADGSYQYVCSEALPEVSHLLATGEHRILVGGSAGTSLTLNDGCKWKQTLGPQATESVLGIHHNHAAPDRVVIVFGQKGQVYRSTDGGHTVSDTPIFAVGNVSFLSFSGRGEALALLARSETSGEERLWWSGDFGNTFAEFMLPTGPSHQVLAVTGEVVWLVASNPDGAGGFTLGRFTLSTGAWTDAGTLQSLPEAATVDAEGELWLAMGAAGLWRATNSRELGQVDLRPSTWVSSREEVLWVGGDAEGWGVDAIWKSEDRGVSWVSVFAFDPAVSFSATCFSLMSAQCAAAKTAWESEFPLPTDGDVVSSEPAELVSNGPGGCGSAPGRGLPLPVILFLTTLWYQVRRRAQI